MIVPIAINGVISRMEGIHKIPTIVKKPRVRPYDMKINMVKNICLNMYMSKSKKITEELNLS